MTTRTFVRVVGRLYETGEFEAQTGWETERVARRPDQDPDHRLELVDDQGTVLTEGRVELRTPVCGGQGDREVRRQRVVGYVALHPEGREVRLRRGVQVLYRAELAPHRPSVTRLDVTVGEDGTVAVHWEAQHDRPLRYRLLLIDRERRAIPITDHLDQHQIALAASDLPGAGRCSIAVAATDGLRSSVRTSEPVDLPERPPSVYLASPADGQVVPPDLPITLFGQAFDLAGRELPEDRLAWWVDGQAAGRGRLPDAAGPFEPGEHVVELVYAAAGEAAARAEARVRVPERTAEQEEWRTVSAELEEAFGLGHTRVESVNGDPSVGRTTSEPREG